MIAIPRCLAVKIKRWIFLHTPDGKTSDAMPERKPEHSEFILTKSCSNRLDFFLHGNPNHTRRDCSDSQGANTFERETQSLTRSFNG